MNKKTKETILYHILFWLLFYLIQVLSGIDFSDFTSKYNFLSDTVFTIFLSILVYANILWLLPKLFFRKKYFIYSAFNLTFSFIISYLNTYIQVSYIDKIILEGLIELGYEYVFFSFLEFILYLGAILFLWIAFQQVKVRGEMAKIEKEHKEAQLQLLRSQTQPHFLFNALNNIHFLISNQPEKASDLLLKLSDLLRYQLYETQNECVLLKDEIQNLKNYIALEKIRLSDDVSLKVDLDSLNSDLKIQPFLLLPLVENAFKHSTNSENRWIEIKLKTVENTLLFTTRNTVGKRTKTQVGGLGLKNLRERLEMLFSENCSLEIEEEQGVFTAQLKIVL